MFEVANDFLDEEHILGQPLPDKGLEARQNVHEVETVFNLDEYVIEVEAAYIGGALEKLFCILW